MRRPLTAVAVLVMIAASLSGCFAPDGENEPPKAFAGADVEAEVGEEIIFSGSGLDGDGSIVDFRWDFDGDGDWDYKGGTGARIHVFKLPGDYEAVLQVEDDEGAMAEDTRWVNVTASVHVTVDWTSGTEFQVHVPEGLDVENLEVDWSLLSAGPIPITRTFTHDAGLEKVNNTTYAIDPDLPSLEDGQRHMVRARLGNVVVATRTLDMVWSSDAAGQYNVVYTSDLWDERRRGENLTQLWRSGNLMVEARRGWSRGHFQGNGTWFEHTNRSGLISNETIALSNVTVETGEGNNWGETWWRYVGHGTVEQWDPTGFYVFAWVWDLERAVENGTLTKDDWFRVGRYSGQNDTNGTNGTNSTNGTFEWTRTTRGNQVRQNGEGELYEVLFVRSEKEFEGTNRGLNFTLHNLTLDYDASRTIFQNRTIFRQSTQEVGLEYPDGRRVWINSTWGGFLDDDRDGIANPDPIDYDPERASVFTGPRPRVLVIGDTFTATNFYGVQLTYTAKRADTAIMRTIDGPINVTGVMAEAIHNTTWGRVNHWFWVLEDGPLPGLVFEERITIVRDIHGGGTYDWYRNIHEVKPLQ